MLFFYKDYKTSSLSTSLIPMFELVCVILLEENRVSTRNQPVLLDVQITTYHIPTPGIEPRSQLLLKVEHFIHEYNQFGFKNSKKCI